MNFGGLPIENSNLAESKIVVVPVPFDLTSTWGKGADKGPDAILEASANMELYDIETDSEVYLQGIFTENPIIDTVGPESLAVKVENCVSQHLQNNKFVVTIGGEHSISIGAIFAHVKAFKNVTVLQFDAHSDTRPEYEGSKFNHACVMARAREVAPCVQVGIRSMDSIELPIPDKNKMFFGEQIHGQIEWMQKALDQISENVYITIDLDVFDSSIMPSTGTPEPGGMDWYSVVNFLRLVCTKRNVVGLDVVELCPNPSNKAPNFLASKLIYKVLSYKFNK